MTNKDKPPHDELPFEKALEELDSIVNRLESGDLPLEESLAVFQRGMELADYCGGKLALVEEKLKVLIEKSDGSFKVEEME
ncbi:exodeoxyribonuclease VII small subunit [bacterium]|nr:exodeoxyribonuclease VII small subunit [FCB group bacterium]MBL7190659.1 exodeoxyribonuclease VII small subunit [bacterium]